MSDTTPPCEHSWEDLRPTEDEPHLCQLRAGHHPGVPHQCICGSTLIIGRDF